METLVFFLRQVIPVLDALRCKLEEEVEQTQSKTPVPPTRGGDSTQTDTPSSKSVHKQTLDIKEASAILGLSKATLYKLVCLRSIPYYKIGSRLLFSEQKLQSWMEVRAVEPISIPRKRRSGSRA
jgi:excisionase family DNA binding protein